MSAVAATPTTPRHADQRVQRVITLFEGLSAADVPRLGTLYSPQARFKDPFNTVQGVPAIQRIFAHMFKTLDGPHFTVLSAVAQDTDVFLTWDFSFRIRGAGARAMQIHGASHLQLDADGLVGLHRDYWDAAEELYEKLPWLGALMRGLKRRARS